MEARRAHNPEVVGSSPASATRIEASPTGWRFCFCTSQNLNPFQCQMPVAFGSNQFKNWLQLYDFASQSQHSSPASATIKTPDFNMKSGVFLTFYANLRWLQICFGDSLGIAQNRGWENPNFSIENGFSVSPAIFSPHPQPGWCQICSAK